MKKIFFLTLIVALLLPLEPVRAEKFEAPEKGFSIDPSEDWSRIPQNHFQGSVVSYARKGSTALFHVTERDLDEAKTVEDLKWEDLFSPQFESIVIKTEGNTQIGNEKAKYCVYTIKPGPFKNQMEGPVPAKYINYVIPRGKSLFSVTFVDTFENFSLDYSSFLAAVRTIRFSDPKIPENATNTGLVPSDPLAGGPKTGAALSSGSVDENKPLDFKAPETA